MYDSILLSIHVKHNKLKEYEFLVLVHPIILVNDLLLQYYRGHPRTVSPFTHQCVGSWFPNASFDMAKAPKYN